MTGAEIARMGNYQAEGPRQGRASEVREVGCGNAQPEGPCNLAGAKTKPSVPGSSVCRFGPSDGRWPGTEIGSQTHCHKGRTLGNEFDEAIGTSRTSKCLPRSLTGI